ncbi:MAG: LOG family protein [Planctomycetota bacterium]|jgi:uncharacterized protein (TIGR00730 family)
MPDTNNHNHRPPSNPIRQKAIDQFLDEFADVPDKDLLAEMMIAICRLAKDGTDRGDLKLLTRAFKELRYAFKVFAPYAHVRKVSIFGSSRTPKDHPDYIQADTFARRMRQLNWMVITGAGDGIMRAGHDGAGKAASFGVAIRLPYEQKTNTIISEDPKLISFNYFFTRKLMFIKEASAVALFPGGFGTQDEGFETLTLIQTGKTEMIPIILIDAPGGTYWQKWKSYIEKVLLPTAMIAPQDLHLYTITDNVEHAVQEIVQFYTIYHSARYVGDLLAMRLNLPMTDQILEKLNDTFSDIITEGRIEQHPGPLDEENGELPEKPRLTLKFNHKDYGRLRLLIDQVNKT